MTTPNITTVEQLYEVRTDICEPMREWLADNGITDMADAWDRCHRADWMLWLDDALALLTDRERRLIACRCVRETPLSDGRKVWDLLTDERSRQAVAVAERYAVGEATDEQLAAAYAAATAVARVAAARAYTAYAVAAAAAAAGAADATRAVYAADATRAVYAARAASATAYTAYAAKMDVADAMYADAAAAPDAARACAAYAATAYAAEVDAVYATQADLIREIAGNPWRRKA
jgi:hypothetical protein